MEVAINPLERGQKREKARQEIKPRAVLPFHRSLPKQALEPGCLLPSCLLLLAAIVGSAITFIILSSFARSLQREPPTQVTASAPTPALRFADLLEVNPKDLKKWDIAEMNLLCAKGLPGSENLDVQASLKILDGWTDAVWHETQRNWHRFLEHPQEYENSEAFYKMGMLRALPSLERILDKRRGYRDDD